MMRPYLKFFAFLLLTLTLLPLQLVLRNPKIALFYHRALAKIMQIKVIKIGEPLPNMLISNHTSWLDIVVLGSVTPLSFIAKSEVKDWFLFGFLARLQGTVFISRQNPRQAIEALRAIKSSTLALVLFAEGTTSDGTLILPFNATLVQSPAQPVMICYADKATAWIGDMTLLPHIWAMFKKREIKVTVKFHPSLTGDRKDITRQAENIIRLSHGNMLY